MEGKNCVIFAFIKSFSIYLGWVSCFYYCKITFFIIGNAPLILKSFKNKTDVILFLIRCFYSLMRFYLQFHCWFFWTTFATSLLFYCSISFVAMSIMNGNYNFMSNNVKGIKASEKRLTLFEYLRNNINNNTFTRNIFVG